MSLDRMHDVYLEILHLAQNVLHCSLTLSSVPLLEEEASVLAVSVNVSLSS